MHNKKKKIRQESILLRTGKSAIIEASNQILPERRHGRMAKASQVVLLENEFYLIKAPNRTGVGDQELQHGERRGHPSVGLRRASVAAVAVRGCWRGTLADQEPLSRASSSIWPLAAWSRAPGCISGAAPARAEPVLGSRSPPGTAGPRHPQRAGRQIHRPCGHEHLQQCTGPDLELRLGRQSGMEPGARLTPTPRRPTPVPRKSGNPEPTPSQRKHQNESWCGSCEQRPEKAGPRGK